MCPHLGLFSAGTQVCEILKLSNNTLPIRQIETASGSAVAVGSGVARWSFASDGPSFIHGLLRCRALSIRADIIEDGDHYYIHLTDHHAMSLSTDVP